MPKNDAHHILSRMEKEVAAKANFNMPREGVFRGVLKAAFIKSFEFTSYAHKVTQSDANEGAFFMASALRGICEDLIALKFMQIVQQRNLLFQLVESLAIHGLLASIGRIRQSALRSQARMVGVRKK